MIHDFRFDSNCLIKSMDLYHDPYIAAEAFQGFPTPSSPIMRFLTVSPPPSSYQVNSGSVLDWQFIPGSEKVTSQQAWANAIAPYYKAFQASQNVSQYFIETDFTIPQAYASLYTAGDSSVLPLAGLWLGNDQMDKYHTLRSQIMTEDFNTLQNSMYQISDDGDVVVHYIWKGKSKVAICHVVSISKLDIFNRRLGKFSHAKPSIISLWCLKQISSKLPD